MHYSRCRHAACAERSVSRCDGSGHAACPADHPPFRCAVYYGYAPDNKRIYQVAPGRYGSQESWTRFLARMGRSWVCTHGSIPGLGSAREGTGCSTEILTTKG